MAKTNKETVVEEKIEPVKETTFPLYCQFTKTCKGFALFYQRLRNGNIHYVCKKHKLKDALCTLDVPFDMKHETIV